MALLAFGALLSCKRSTPNNIAPVPSEKPAPAPTPAPLPPIAAGFRLAAGETSTCLIGVDRKLSCWGGQPIASAKAKVVPGLEKVRQVAIAQKHVCALVEGGVVQCWGQNAKGELGNGSRSTATAPTLVALPALATHVAAAGGTSCAALADSTVVCWGNGEQGQLGDPTVADSDRPRRIGALTGVVETAVGAFGHACARTSGGDVWCWGSNRFGQLGIGAGKDSPTPVRVEVKATRLVAGFAHTCVIAAGKVSCWGWNDEGILGDGTTTDRSVPGFVSSLTDVTQLVAGDFHTCALKGPKEMWCWGRNTDGELGDMSKARHLVPHGSAEPKGIAAVALGTMLSCVLLANEETHCWGRAPL